MNFNIFPIKNGDIYLAINDDRTNEFMIAFPTKEIMINGGGYGMPYGMPYGIAPRIFSSRKIR